MRIEGFKNFFTKPFTVEHEGTTHKLGTKSKIASGVAAVIGLPFGLVGAPIAFYGTAFICRKIKEYRLNKEMKSASEVGPRVLHTSGSNPSFTAQVKHPEDHGLLSSTEKQALLEDEETPTEADDDLDIHGETDEESISETSSSTSESAESMDLQGRLENEIGKLPESEAKTEADLFPFSDLERGSCVFHQTPEGNVSAIWKDLDGHMRIRIFEATPEGLKDIKDTDIDTAKSYVSLDDLKEGIESDFLKDVDEVSGRDAEKRLRARWTSKGSLPYLLRKSSTDARKYVLSRMDQAGKIHHYYFWRPKDTMGGHMLDLNAIGLGNNPVYQGSKHADASIDDLETNTGYHSLEELFEHLLGDETYVYAKT